MKLIITLTAIAFFANASQESFEIGPYLDNTETLPSADFKRKVDDFDASKQIWDQYDYTERVRVEAEILVALEALKQSVHYLHYDFIEINGRIEVSTG